MINRALALPILLLLLASCATQNSDTYKESIDVKARYGTITFEGTINFTKTPETVTMDIKQMFVRFIPDAHLNQVPEAPIRHIRLIGRMRVLDGEMVNIHMEQQDLHINLDKDNREAEFGNFTFEMPTDVYLRSDYVRFSVTTDSYYEGLAIAWPIKAELRDLVKE